MKNVCTDMEILLAEFAGDDLDAATAERVAVHVAGCDDCRAELNRELVLRRALGSLSVQEGPAIAVPASRTRRAYRRRWWSLAGGLAAAALAAAIFLPSGPGNEPTTPTINDVAAVRRDACASLALAARILERSERHTVVDVFGRQLPAAIRGTLPDEAVTPEGGQG